MSGPGCIQRKRDWDIEDTGDVLKSARADAVGPTLVFLDLLEGNAETVTEPFLAHAAHGPAQSDATSNMDVN